MRSSPAQRSELLHGDLPHSSAYCACAPVPSDTTFNFTLFCRALDSHLKRTHFSLPIISFMRLVDIFWPFQIHLVMKTFAHAQICKLSKFISLANALDVALKNIMKNTHLVHLLCIKRCHLFVTLLESFSSLGKALKLSLPLKAGLSPEILIFWVFCVLILWLYRCCILLLLPNKEGTDVDLILGDVRSLLKNSDTGQGSGTAVKVKTKRTEMNKSGCVTMTGGSLRVGVIIYGKNIQKYFLD